MTWNELFMRILTAVVSNPANADCTDGQLVTRAKNITNIAWKNLS